MADDKKKARFKDVMLRREGTTIVLPEHPKPGMTEQEAIDWLTAKMQADEQKIAMKARINVFPIEGLVALTRTLEKRFGFTKTEGITQTFFGPMKSAPSFREVELSNGQKVNVPDGGRSAVLFSIPGAEGAQLSYTFDINEQLPVFVLTATTPRKWEHIFTEIFNLVRQEATENSMFKGKAIIIDKFPTLEELQENGPFCFEPKFMDISRADRTKLIFSKELEHHIEALMFAPMLWTERMKTINVGPKRAVLLEGPPGTGKTELAFALAKECVQRNITFALLKNINDFDKFMLFLKRYGPARGFVEDIDQIASGSRDEAINDLLNTMSGVLTKRQDIGIVATTNNVEVITSAMLRPERFDAVLHIGPPDAEAVTRLIRQYAGELVPKEDPLTHSSEILKNSVPAFVREAVERAKLFMVARTGEHAPNVDLCDSDIAAAATTLNQQQMLVNRGVGAIPDKRTAFERGCNELAQAIKEANSIDLTTLSKIVATTIPATRGTPSETGFSRRETTRLTRED